MQMFIAAVAVAAGGLFCRSTVLGQQPAVQAQPSAAANYSCPMRCEGEKTYDKPGRCPVCQMKLKAMPLPGQRAITLTPPTEGSLVPLKPVTLAMTIQPAAASDKAQKT